MIRETQQKGKYEIQNKRSNLEFYLKKILEIQCNGHWLIVHYGLESKKGFLKDSVVDPRSRSGDGAS